MRWRAPSEAVKELAIGVRVDGYYENKTWLPGLIMQISGLKVHSTTTKSKYEVKHDDMELILYWTGSIRHRLSNGSHGTTLKKRQPSSPQAPLPSPKKSKIAHSGLHKREAYFCEGGHAIPDSISNWKLGRLTRRLGVKVKHDSDKMNALQFWITHSSSRMLGSGKISKDTNH